MSISQDTKQKEALPAKQCRFALNVDHLKSAVRKTVEEQHLESSQGKGSWDPALVVHVCTVRSGDGQFSGEGT